MSLRVLVCSLLLSCVRAQTPAPVTPASPAPTPVTKPSSESQDPHWDSAASVQALYWLPRMNPVLRGGKTAAAFGDIDFTTKTKGIPAGMFSMPVSHTDVLRFSYFQTQASGTKTVLQDTTEFGSTFVAGDALTSKYTMQTVKASFESLFYPFPTERAKLRFKTLWEVQYLNFKTQLDSTGVDTTGAATTNTAKGSSFLVLPTLGMAMAYSVSRNVHFDLRGSGFMIPHRANLGDSEATGSFRMGPVDLVVGGRYYHFRTSPKKDQFASASMPGAYVGVRWYFK